MEENEHIFLKSDAALEQGLVPLVPQEVREVVFYGDVLLVLW